MKVQSMLEVLLLTLVSGTAYALVDQPLPEPGSLELLAIGAVAAIAVAIRKRRK